MGAEPHCSPGNVTVLIYSQGRFAIFFLIFFFFFPLDSDCDCDSLDIYNRYPEAIPKCDAYYKRRFICEDEYYDEPWEFCDSCGKPSNNYRKRYYRRRYYYRTFPIIISSAIISLTILCIFRNKCCICCTNFDKRKPKTTISVSL